MRRRASARPFPVFAAVALLSGCGSDSPAAPEADTWLRGFVTVDGAPSTFGQAIVLLFAPTGQHVLTAGTDASGQYTIAATQANQVCSTSLIAFIDRAPFPMESLRRPAVEGSVTPCVGDIDGTDFDFPDPGEPLESVRISGTVTQGGSAASTALTLVIEGWVWTSGALDTTTSEADGSYELVAMVPSWYCTSMRVYATTTQFFGVAGCGDISLDVALS